MSIAAWGPEAGVLLGWGAGTVVRATLVLAGAFALSLFLRRASAATRHALWTVTLAAVVLLPALSLVLPPVPLPVADRLPAALLLVPDRGEVGADGNVEAGEASAGEASMWRDAGEARVSPLAGAAGRTESPAAPAARSGVVEEVGPAEFAGPAAGGAAVLLSGMLLFWALGAVVLGAALALGVRRARLTCRRARPIRDEVWLAALRKAREAVGMRCGVSLRISPDVRTGMAGGWMRPVVLLPESARAWCPERRELVLVHELVHLKRRDPLRKLCGRVALALYWFHPLAWCAVRASALAREEACDEAVLALGHQPSAYARHLVELADRAPLPLPAIARIDRSHLEKRIMKLLRRSAPASPRWAPAVVALAVAWILAVAAAVPVDRVEAASPAAAAADVAAGPLPPALAPQGAVAPTPPRPVAPEESVAPAPPSGADPRDACRLRADGPDFEDGRDFGVRGADVVAGSGDRFVQRSLDAYMLCMRTRGPLRIDGGRVTTMPDGSWLVLAARGEETLQRLEITAGPDGPERAWFVGGEARPFDEEAAEWQEAILAYLHAHGEIARVRGDEARLRGEIARARGEEARLRGEIARVRGEGARLRGEVARAQGEGASLQGEMARIRGEEARLRGEIARVRGEAARVRGETSRAEAEIAALERARQISGDTILRARLEAELEEARRALEASRRALSDVEIERAVAEIQERLEAFREEASVSLAELEGRLGSLDLETRVREIESRHASYEAEAASRVTELEEAIAELDTAGRITEIERRIEGLDTETRIRELQEDVRGAEERLRELLSRVR